MRKAIAIDFDGCLCTDVFPDIGKPNWPVIHKAKSEQKAGAGLILWTCREGQLLQDAIAACESWGLTFDAVNESLPDWIEAFKNQPRKVGATEYWDDKAINPINALPFPRQKDELESLLAQAHILAVERRPEACLGCGFKHNCSLQGCAVVNRLIEMAVRDADNSPLTLDELREMDGEPVWIVSIDGQNNPCWMLVDVKYELCRETHGGMAVFENCGKTWLTYRRKPSGSDNGTKMEWLHYAIGTREKAPLAQDNSASSEFG